MLAALLLVLVAARAEPPPLHAPAPAPPPSADEAVAAVESLQAAARGEIEVAWLRGWVRPSQLSTAPDEGWYARLARSLDPQRPLGRTLVRHEVAHAVQGPDYTRVVLEGEHPLTAVVRRSGEGVVIDRLELSTCSLCDEPVRFVRDLLDDVRRRGPRAHRLVPGVDLDLDAHLEDHRSLAGTHWTSTLQLRLTRDPEVRRLLAGATVESAQGEEVVVRLADGRLDRWLVWHREGRWQLRYEALAEDSPLRLSATEARAWRSDRLRAQLAVSGWSPSWEEREGALQVGHGAVGAAFHPRDHTLVVAALDPDRALTALFVVDPWARAVVARHALPVSEATQLPVGGWYGLWELALSPDGATAAVTGPGRVWTVDLDTGTRRQLTRTRGVADLAWSEDGLLVVAERRGAVSLWAPEGMRWVARLPGEPAAVVVVDQVVAVTRDGEVVAMDRLTGEQTPLGVACCERAVDAAARPDGSELLVTCADTCDAVAERWDLVGLHDVGVVEGVGCRWRGASWSPGGRWFTAGSASHPLLLWEAGPGVPVGALGQAPPHAVRWAPDASAAAVIGVDGEVWLWDLPGVLAAGL